jgi:hypothetical protein
MSACALLAFTTCFHEALTVFADSDPLSSEWLLAQRLAKAKSGYQWRKLQPARINKWRTGVYRTLLSVQNENPSSRELKLLFHSARKYEIPDSRRKYGQIT